MAIDVSQILQHAKNAVGHFTDKAVKPVNAEATSPLSNAGNLVGEPTHPIDTVTTNLGRSINHLSEFTEKLKTSVQETATGAVSTITEVTNQATNTATETARQSSEAFNAVASVAAQKLTDAATLITQTAGKTRIALDETVQKAGQASNVLSNSLQTLVVTSNPVWLEEHPMVAWLVAHPLWAIALILLTLFLSWSLLGAIAQFTQQAFLLILQAPLKLIQSLFRGVFLFFKRSNRLPSTQLEGEQKIQKRLVEILNRLERLRQEQEALMKEMQTILLAKR